MAVRLLKPADRDLDSILEYGLERWGRASALKYYDGLLAHLELINANPELYPASSWYRRAGVRRSPYGRHHVYYWIEGNDVVVVRVLGNRQDPLARLGEVLGPDEE